MLAYLEKVPNIVPIIVDNKSTYGPMVDFLNETKHQVIRLSKNLGVYALWEHKLIRVGEKHKLFFGDNCYAVTDGDLDLEGCPLDLVEVLRIGLERYSWARKSGLGLEIEDIPEGCLHRKDVIEWEPQFWVNRLDERFFESPVDTTFFLQWCHVVPTTRQDWIFKTLRSDRPYVARHLPWYETLDTLTEEDLFYYKNIATDNYVHWSSRTKNLVSSLPRTKLKPPQG
jgi:hypothetical protein